MRVRPSRSSWLVAAVAGAAAFGYLAPRLPNGWLSRPDSGVWDVTVATVTEPKLLVVVYLTVALVASVIRREPVLPELLRLGSWRAYLAREAWVAARATLPSVVTVVAVCLIVAAITGLPWQSEPSRGPAPPPPADIGLPGPVVVLAQVLQMVLAMTVLRVGLTAIRITTGSIVLVVAAALMLFSWSSVSVLALTTTITPTPSGSLEVAQELGGDVSAGLNTITYLDLPIALSSGPQIVVVGLGTITALSFAAATALDARVLRARRPLTRPAGHRLHQH